MTLQTCLECKQQVSTNAPVCPHCGNPTGSVVKPKEIELTGKKYKKRAIFLVIFVLISFVLLINQQWAIGVPLLIISLIGATINNIQRWWNNG